MSLVRKQGLGALIKTPQGISGGIIADIPRQILNSKRHSESLGSNIYSSPTQTMTSGKMYKFTFDSDATNGTVTLSNTGISHNIQAGNNTVYGTAQSTSGTWTWSTTANITNISFQEVTNASWQDGILLEDFSKGGRKYELIQNPADSDFNSLTNWRIVYGNAHVENGILIFDSASTRIGNAIGNLINITELGVYALKFKIKGNGVNFIKIRLQRDVTWENLIEVNRPFPNSFNEYVYYGKIDNVGNYQIIIENFSSTICEIDYIYVYKVSNGNHGTIYGGAELTIPADGYWIELDGVNDYEDYGDVVNPNSDSLVYMQWVKTTDTNKPILNKISTGAGYKVYIDASGYLQASVSDGTNTATTTSTLTINDGKSHLIYAIINRATGNLIVGELGQLNTEASVSLGSVGAVTNTDNLYIGFDGTNYLNASVGTGEIYTTSFVNTAIIQDVYNKTKSKYLP